MIVRSWRGVITAARALEYLDYLLETAVKDYLAVVGNRGVQICQRTFGDKTEFLVLSFWESYDAIRAFAGDDCERAVYYSKDAEFLLEREEKVLHYVVEFELL
ncbi:hypothetical protein EPA93_12010 [Ktedonosporobacter rubrisoli]|uniref:Antibiotic biosynthesis monooxygenase n=1 Tax=Ktedonosporobacter rubrisoli TaxID=2509675 RepID=A0A4P6JN09_KTERU|nr:hypothetical protein [Ktedonosporobacter rubrisoli]QBD76687.1 hypothetical protein EPA93_12010 [Ktedonosporobacter rubrisoli]